MARRGASGLLFVLVPSRLCLVLASGMLAQAAFSPIALSSATAQTQVVQAEERDAGDPSSVFIQQAPENAAADGAVGDGSAGDPNDDTSGSSQVYYPGDVAPSSDDAARQRAAQQQQLEQAPGADRELAQLSQEGDDAQDLIQLSDGDSARALAQLTSEERQVLLDAVEGTDICERVQNIPSIRELCDARLETRSEEFATAPPQQSAEDVLLGGRIDNSRIATLEAAITRLARSSGRPDDLSDQAIASVALAQQNTLSGTEVTATDGDPAAEFSAETQALINAIVNNLGGN